MKARSLLGCLMPVACLAVLSAQPVAADEQGLLLRRGFFKELTNAEATAFTIQSFRISGDGSKIAYFGWDGTNHSLWVMDADGQNKTLVEQTFQWMSLYNGLYDISHDGSTIGYLRLSSVGDPTPEVTAYDVATTSKTTLLKFVPVSYYGNPEQWHIEPQSHPGLVRLSGDGSRLFFLNRFGPFVGTISSGFTYYRVDTDGGGFTDVFQTVDIPTITGIGSDTGSLVPWDGEIAVDFTGTFLAITTASGSGDTDLVTMDADGGSAVVIQDVRDGNFFGPSMSADGSKIAFARGGTAAPETTGTFVANTGLPQVAVQVDPASGYWAVCPHLSSDGGSVVYNFDLGGGSSPSIRWAHAGGSLRLPITEPMVTAWGARAMVAPYGSPIFMLAQTSRTASYGEIVRFDLGSTPFSDVPRVNAVIGSPDMTVDLDGGPSTFLYTTFGSSLREMYSMPFTDDPAELYFSGFSGLATWGYLYDDGSTDGDAVAGDGVFTDGNVYLSATPPAGADPFFVRAGVASDLGVAAFADFLCSFSDPYAGVFGGDFEAGDLTGWSAIVP